MTIQLVFLVIAFICFMCGAAQVPAPRVNFTALGLAFWVLTLIIN